MPSTLIKDISFERSLQKCGSIADELKFKKKHPDAYLDKVSALIVKILDYKEQNPFYILPKALTCDICKHKLQGACWLEKGNSSKPCSFPHSYALQYAALFIRNINTPRAKTTDCSAQESCTFGQYCKFRHKEDTILAQKIKKIYEQRNGDDQAWETVGKGSKLATSQKRTSSKEIQDENIFACLNEEDDLPEAESAEKPSSQSGYIIDAVQGDFMIQGILSEDIVHSGNQLLIKEGLQMLKEGLKFISLADVLPRVQIFKPIKAQSEEPSFQAESSTAEASPLSSDEALVAPETEEKKENKRDLNGQPALVVFAFDEASPFTDFGALED